MKTEKINLVPALETRIKALGKFNALVVAGLAPLMPNKAWADAEQPSIPNMVCLPQDAWAWLDKAAEQMHQSRNDLLTAILVRVYPESKAVA